MKKRPYTVINRKMYIFEFNLIISLNNDSTQCLMKCKQFKGFVEEYSIHMDLKTFNFVVPWSHSTEIEGEEKLDKENQHTLLTIRAFN